MQQNIKIAVHIVYIQCYRCTSNFEKNKSIIFSRTVWIYKKDSTKKCIFVKFNKKKISSFY